MNCKIGVLALVALQACSINALRPCVCARNLNPVCGSDGITYSNACKLDCEKYTVKSDLTKVSDGPCPGSEYPAYLVCICTMDYKPVCGTDGITYPNSCVLRCKLPTNSRLGTAHDGACESAPLCTCTDNLEEVCGSDGKPYANTCLLKCAAETDSSLSIAHSGKCDSVKVVDVVIPTPPPCTCARNVRPVCGSDGKTYGNDCLLNCATANDNTLSISHQGACGDVNVVNDKPAPSGAGCTCTRDLKPVCGSDGVSYNNICLLECAGQSVASYGPC